MISLFKKHQIVGFIFLLFAVLPATVFSQAKKQTSTSNSEATQKSVVINGVSWSTRNVDTPGTFVARPEDAGKLYQWNSRMALATTGGVTNWKRGGTQTVTAWKKTSDPSPAGFRVPTYAEIYKLLDTSKVKTEWTTQNGVKGRKFTDKATGKSVFFPAAGCREHTAGMLENVGTFGYYWSGNKPNGNNGAYSMHFSEKYAQKSVYICNYGFFIRPVVAE